MVLDEQFYELATENNFSERGYLLANSDVAKATQAFGYGRTHFETFGKNERRLQLTLEGQIEFSRLKFSKFRNAIDLSSAQFLLRENAFPISYTPTPLALESYDGESSNPLFELFDRDIKENPGKLYADIGCGFRSEILDNCLYIEVYRSASAEMIVNTDCRYPLRSSSLDGIGCFAVLEHVTKPWIVVEEIHRILKPGGKCYIDWPFLQPVHGYPSHYFNATQSGLVNIFKDTGFKIERVATEHFQTPDWAVSWIVGKMIRELPDPGIRERILSMTVRELIDLDPATGFWKEFTEAMTAESLSEFSAGNTLVAVKPIK